MTKPSRPTRAAAKRPRQERKLVAVRVLDEIYRVDEATQTIGYVEKAGSLYVSLKGEVYNTSVEVAQCHDLETAVEKLRSAT